MSYENYEKLRKNISCGLPTTEEMEDFIRNSDPHFEVDKSHGHVSILLKFTPFTGKYLNYVMKFRDSYMKSEGGFYEICDNQYMRNTKLFGYSVYLVPVFSKHTHDPERASRVAASECSRKTNHIQDRGVIIAGPSGKVGNYKGLHPLLTLEMLNYQHNGAEGTPDFNSGIHDGTSDKWLLKPKRRIFKPLDQTSARRGFRIMSVTSEVHDADREYLLLFRRKLLTDQWLGAGRWNDGKDISAVAAFNPCGYRLCVKIGKAIVWSETALLPRFTPDEYQRIKNGEII